MGRGVTSRRCHLYIHFIHKIVTNNVMNVEANFLKESEMLSVWCCYVYFYVGYIRCQPPTRHVSNSIWEIQSPWQSSALQMAYFWIEWLTVNFISLISSIYIYNRYSMCALNFGNHRRLIYLKKIKLLELGSTFSPVDTL